MQANAAVRGRTVAAASPAAVAPAAPAAVSAVPAVPPAALGLHFNLLCARIRHSKHLHKSRGGGRFACMPAIQ